MSRDTFITWLNNNNINLNGKYKNKRWGSIVLKDDNQWIIHICVQYDEYLEKLLEIEPQLLDIVVNSRTEYKGCGHCIEGKCAFTGFDLVNPSNEDIEIAKKMILFRINAIKEERIPNCSYIKISKRNDIIEPCTKHKICNPKCRAMKR